MSKRIVFVLVIVVLIIAGIYMAKKISKGTENIQTAGNMVNELVNDINEVLDNNAIEAEVENEIEETNSIEQEVKNTDKPEEKAIEIVKNNWGPDDTVYYSYDGIDKNGKYIICVRDKNTTKALYFYYVDIETGTFDID